MMVAANNAAAPKGTSSSLSSCSAIYIGLFFKCRGAVGGEGGWCRGGGNLDENFVLQWLLKDEAINC